MTDFEIFESGNVTLGKNEFVNCSNLRDVRIQSSKNSIVQIDSACFSKCSGSIRFNLSNGELTINNNIFSYNQLFTQLNFIDLDKLTIENEQFANSESLQSAAFISKSDISFGLKCFSIQ